MSSQFIKSFAFAFSLQNDLELASGEKLSLEGGIPDTESVLKRFNEASRILPDWIQKEKGQNIPLPSIELDEHYQLQTCDFQTYDFPLNSQTPIFHATENQKQLFSEQVRQAFKQPNRLYLQFNAFWLDYSGKSGHSISYNILKDPNTGRCYFIIVNRGSAFLGDRVKHPQEAEILENATVLCFSYSDFNNFIEKLDSHFAQSILNPKTKLQASELVQYLLLNAKRGYRDGTNREVDMEQRLEQSLQKAGNCGYANSIIAWRLLYASKLMANGQDLDNALRLSKVHAKNIKRIDQAIMLAHLAGSKIDEIAKEALFKKVVARFFAETGTTRKGYKGKELLGVLHFLTERERYKADAQAAIEYLTQATHSLKKPFQARFNKTIEKLKLPSKQWQVEDDYLLMHFDVPSFSKRKANTLTRIATLPGTFAKTTCTQMHSLIIKEMNAELAKQSGITPKLERLFALYALQEKLVVELCNLNKLSPESSDYGEHQKELHSLLNKFNRQAQTLLQPQSYKPLMYALIMTLAVSSLLTIVSAPLYITIGLALLSSAITYNYSAPNQSMFFNKQPSELDGALLTFQSEAYNTLQAIEEVHQQTQLVEKAL